MNEDSIILLREINSGCKNATNSFGQVLDFVKDDYLAELIHNYNNEHVKIGDECHEILNNHNHDEEDPPSMAKAMMWFSTEIKMMMDNDDSRIAELLADGCNMGIKSISRYIHQNKNASQEVMDLADNLIDMEMELYKKLMQFLI